MSGMTQQEQQLLKAFEGMTDEDRAILLDFAKTRASKNMPCRPQFKLINGGNQPQQGA